MAKRGRPRCLDLYCGVGGLSLGLQRAGAEIIGGLEVDELASRTHAFNFHRAVYAEERECLGRPRDIRAVEPLELLREWGHLEPESVVDLVALGVPAGNGASDWPAQMMRFVEALLPVIVLVEGHALNGGLDAARARLRGIGFRDALVQLDVASVGVPHAHTRQALVAWHVGVGDLSKALSALRGPDAPPSREEALGDLPSAQDERCGEGPRELVHFVEYDRAPTSAYARLMRLEWAGFENSGGLVDQIRPAGGTAPSPTVREAARLASFPDGFSFLGNASEAFERIEGATPPLWAYALGCAVLSGTGGSQQA